MEIQNNVRKKTFFHYASTHIFAVGELREEHLASLVMNDDSSCFFNEGTSTQHFFF